MSITELITSAQILIDADGNKKAVQLDWPVWEELLSILEDMEEQEPQLLNAVAESRHAYQTGQVKRGTADDLIAELEA